MPSINKFYTTEFTVTRGGWTTDSEGFSSSAPTEVGTFMGHIQQITPKLAQYLNLNFTKTYSVWTAPDSDVKSGDIITDGTKYYSVKEIQNNAMVGSNMHLELVVEESEEVGS
jgi:hypothetical protein